MLPLICYKWQEQGKTFLPCGRHKGLASPSLLAMALVIYTSAVFAAHLHLPARSQERKRGDAERPPGHCLQRNLDVTSSVNIKSQGGGKAALVCKSKNAGISWKTHQQLGALLWKTTFCMKEGYWVTPIVWHQLTLWHDMVTGSLSPSHLQFYQKFLPPPPPSPEDEVNFSDLQFSSLECPTTVDGSTIWTFHFRWPGIPPRNLYLFY